MQNEGGRGGGLEQGSSSDGSLGNGDSSVGS